MKIIIIVIKIILVIFVIIVFNRFLLDFVSSWDSTRGIKDFYLFIYYFFCDGRLVVIIAMVISNRRLKL